MFCRNCGHNLDDKAVVCTQCGRKPRDGDEYCDNCGEETSSSEAFCPRCGVELGPSYPDHLLKSKIVAGILGLFLGGLGIHRFYLGYTGIGILQIVVTFITCGIGAWWGFIEGILILVGSTITTDSEGRPLKDS